MAAAVDPDAFSSLAGKPQSQLKIGKSIFYNERINTTGSGLVQVLLVDGSTFSVGPGSDLVIDKFVYDPMEAGLVSSPPPFADGTPPGNAGVAPPSPPAAALTLPDTLPPLPDVAKADPPGPPDGIVPGSAGGGKGKGK